MTQETEREVYRAHRDAQTRYAYFLLTAAGAAIGLAVSQTQTATLKLSMIPLGAAVVSWGLSFFCGCRHLLAVELGLYANMGLLKVESGQHPQVGQDPRSLEIAMRVIRDALETHGNRASRYGRWQFRFLVCGAVLYIAWHVFEMFLRTP